MRRLMVAIGIVALLVIGVNSTIINIPDDYPTIQQGIDHGQDGDTVLVQPDIYYENLNFNGHNVVLASLFLTTGDTSFVSSTIIDGHQSASVITFSTAEDSRAQVIGFKIQNGHAYDGGGIYCLYSNPTISANTISGNSADLFGGGIYCDDSSPTISNNTISGNSAAFGGGIFYWDSSPTINNNSISTNSADGGGGISCWESSPTIRNNTISGNWANAGGGIECYYSNPTISNNTISGNWAYYHGGGIYCYNWSSPTIANTILWEDTAPNGPELFLEGGHATVSYCDVQGGWPGTGNIDADPVFAGPYNKDFHLRWHSPCIDAGEPSLSDPDGTRSDVGAFYFNQDVDGIVELYPHDTPIVIPPEGGDIIYDGWVFNFLGHPGRVDIWSYAFVPEMGPYGPIHLYENVRIPADSIGMNEIGKYVPGGAPEGDYVFVAYVGDYPTSIIDSSYFYFSKSGSIGDGISYLLESGDWFKQASSTAGSLPSDYAISQNYPNPFNAITIINYELPVASYVKLEVYNLFGQKVTTLVDSKQEAGYRSVVWQASEVSSGVYFYRLTAGEFTETKRMMLVK